ncbi:transposase (plasmid) [Lichenicola cladoniae]|uniref:Transposase n=2 Tax=Lichenicola cladoniae TaxID=1484109 RepID=A0A6M8HXC9_9PROT|nr:transposase [Acetobacteraceae bacterium]QKE93204.1 transposase [Lichenicola cladoniae]
MMTNKTRRSFTDDFKREAVSLLVSSGRPLIQVAAGLGIQPSMLRSWRGPADGVARPSSESSLPASKMVPSADQLEIRRLRRELEHAQMERDILKNYRGPAIRLRG